MSALCLGIDVQATRLGLALVEFDEPYRALWADTVRIDRRDGGWRHEQVRLALMNHAQKFVEAYYTYDAVTRIGIEQPWLVGSRLGIFEAGGVFALVGAECHRRWPWADQVTLQPGEWRRLALGKGRATKWDVMEWANARLSFDFPLQQDSADALAIAVAAAKVALTERVA